MARIPRLVVPGVPHHITQRGNNHQQVFFSDQDYLFYLALLRRYSQKFQLSLWGYCLMPNHIHLIAVPQQPGSLASALARTHAEYARSSHNLSGASGHFWQARFYSCPMDEDHCWRALAYVERNPVRAGLTKHASAYEWSSANAHLGGPDPSRALDNTVFHALHNPESWQLALSATARDQALEQRIRGASRTGRPLGGTQFIEALQVTPKPPGRKSAHA